MSLDSATTPTSNLRLSIVVATCNSANTIEVFLDRLLVAVEQIPEVALHQLIVIDDCSQDATVDKVRLLSERVPELQVIRLSRNRGQQIAVSAGIAHCTGDLTLLIDDDGQNPIGEIRSLIRRFMQSDVDVVIATSQHRKLGRRITSRLFWFAMRGSRLADEPEDQLLMRVLSRRVVEAFKRYPETTRTVYGIVRDIGFGVVGHAVKIGPHIHGRETSRYSSLDRLDIFLDTYLTSANKPFGFLLRVSVFCGLLGGGLSLAGLLMGFASRGVETFVLLALGVSLLILAAALLLVDVMLRLFNLIYLEARRRPLYHETADIGVTPTDSSWRNQQ
jgi:dolichol-phosphate mannosyltransferase